jgi:hypothetical protein
MIELTWVLAYAAVVILLGGLLQGTVGFGFSQFAIPLLVLAWASVELIPIMVILSLVMNVLQLWELRSDVQPRRIWPLMLAGVFGIPIGAYILKVADPDQLKLLIGSLIILFTLAQMAGLRRKVRQERWAMGPIGFAGGVLNGSVSMSGPPLILFFSNQGMTKQEFRANLIAFFLFINIATLPVFLLTGSLTIHVLESSAILMPGMILGTLVGLRVASRIPEDRFRSAVLALLLTFGCMSIASGLGAI